MRAIDEVNEAGPWNCSDETLFVEWRRALDLARAMAEREDAELLIAFVRAFDAWYSQNDIVADGPLLDMEEARIRIGHFDRSCRHGGSCPYCAAGRTFSSRRRAPIEEGR